MSNHLGSHIQMLLSPINSEELRLFLNEIAANNKLADWQLVQRQILGLDAKNFVSCIKQDMQILESERGQLLMETLTGFPNDSANISIDHDILVYWSYSSKRNKFVSNVNGSKKKKSFDYATLKTPIMNGIEYILIFKNDNRVVSEKLTAALIISLLVAWRSISVHPEMEIVGQIKLGNRERQVLFWTSQGKTSFEISKILDLSEHTINNYITNAANKLGTNNRVHTVCRAVLLGLI